MRDVFVLGVGMVRFGKHEGIPGWALGEEALRRALDDAGVRWDRVGLVVGGHIDQGAMATWNLIRRFPQTGVPALTVENASATGSTAMSEAFSAVASGRYDVVAAVGFERLEGGIAALASKMIGPLGYPVVAGLNFPPSIFALLKRHRMHEYGESDEASALVAVKNFGNGALNPHAQRQRVVTLDDVLQSPMIADPIRRLECCPIGDGAAAVIVADRRALAGARRRRVRVLASATASERYHDGWMVHPETGLTARVAARAYESAGVGPADLDIVEVHDAFSVEELMYCEELGLAPEGEAGKLVMEGATAIGGRVAVSPSGGLLARGHPGGPTGLAQIVEITAQLRGEAGPRQHPQAKVGLAHMIGAGGVCVIHVLSV